MLMNAKRWLPMFVATASAFLFASAAQATAMYCAPNGTNTDGLSISDMTYDGGTRNADDCYGIVSGNLSTDGSDLTYLNNLNWGNGWNFLIKDDTPGAGAAESVLFKGLNFSLSATSGQTGNWTLNAVDTNSTAPLGLPATLDFIGILKGATGYAMYYFDDVIFNGSNGGTWAMQIYTKNGKNIADLSHLSLYIRDNCPNHDCTVTEVPEPGMLGLLGMGLLGLGLFRRKRPQ